MRLRPADTGIVCLRSRRAKNGEKTRMFQKEAIVRLLRDNDPATVSLVKEQLIERGSDGVAALRDLLALDDEGVTAHVREVIEKIETVEAQDDMLLCAHLFPEHGDIEAAWWLLTLCFEPDAPIVKLQCKLDGGAGGCACWWRARARRESGSRPSRLHGRGSRISRERGRIYDPKNSFLSDVIQRRQRDPDFARHALCHHRSARQHADRRDQYAGPFHARYERILFDPFHQGRILSRPDCEAILARQRLKTESSYFAPASSRIVLMRMLANLLFVFERTGEERKHGMVKGWLQALGRD